MSLFKHIILLLFCIFATYQSATLEDERSTTKVEGEDVTEVPSSTVLPDIAKFRFNRTSGWFTLKISMEKDECVKTNTQTCPSINTPLRNPEEENKNLGTSKENPGESCDDIGYTGKYYIKSMSDPSFKVSCNLEKSKTCLLIRDLINETSIDRIAIDITKGDKIFWLSQTDFELQSLYNNIESIEETGTNRAQISYLLSTSTAVSQKIKYYYSSTSLSNGTIDTNDNKVGSLKGLLWNDHLVSSEITKQLPMNFTFTDPKECWNKSHWMCSDIMFEDKSNNRLPVTDFYIGDVLRAKPDVSQKIYFDLVELCFYD